MPDTIGGLSFVFVSGSIPGSKRFLRELSRAELDGSAYLQLGAKAASAELTAGRDYTSVSDWRTKLASYEALIGTAVAIAHYGETVTNVLIEDVQPGRHFATAAAVGGIGGYSHWGETRWTVRKL